MYKPGVKMEIPRSRFYAKVRARAEELYEARKKIHWECAEGLLGAWKHSYPKDPMYPMVNVLARAIAEAEAKTHPELRDWLRAEVEIAEWWTIEEQPRSIVSAEHFNVLVAKEAHAIWTSERWELARLDWMNARSELWDELGHFPASVQITERAHQLYLARKDACAAWDWKRAVEVVSDRYVVV